MHAQGTPEEWLAWLAGDDPGKRKEAQLILGGLVPEDNVSVGPLVNGLGLDNSDRVLWCAIGLDRLSW
jgi:hypothetical protein